MGWAIGLARGGCDRGVHRDREWLRRGLYFVSLYRFDGVYALTRSYCSRQSAAPAVISLPS